MGRKKMVGGGGWCAVGSSWPLTPFLNGSYMPLTATHPPLPSLHHYFSVISFAGYLVALGTVFIVHAIISHYLR